MNPNRRIHKDLVVESHQDLQHEKNQSLTLNQSSSGLNNAELATRCEGEIKNFAWEIQAAKSIALNYYIARPCMEIRKPGHI